MATMTEYIYKVVTEDEEIYWVDDATTILESFGTVLEVTKYALVEVKDVTDEINGDYYLD
jgi:hypothetical protein